MYILRYYDTYHVNQKICWGARNERRAQGLLESVTQPLY